MTEPHVPAADSMRALAIDQAADIERLEARCAELEAALAEITSLHADFDLTCDHSVGVCCCRDIAAIDKARAVLAGEDRA